VIQVSFKIKKMIFCVFICFCVILIQELLFLNSIYINLAQKIIDGKEYDADSVAILIKFGASEELKDSFLYCNYKDKENVVNLINFLCSGFDPIFSIDVMKILLRDENFKLKVISSTEWVVFANKFKRCIL
jgi:hypothetical protein